MLAVEASGNDQLLIIDATVSNGPFQQILDDTIRAFAFAHYAVYNFVIHRLDGLG